MSWSFIADVLSLILIISGSLLTLAAAIGIARFKDTMSRVHAVSKPQTTGLILTMLGAFIRITASGPVPSCHRSSL